LGPAGTFRPQAPELRTTADPDEERHATWFELFFDLVFVAAVAQLGAGLVRNPSAAVFARFAGLFVVIFWAWVLYALYANRFDTDDLIFRLAKSGAMLAVAAIAINVHRSARGARSRATPW
jgi:low temperature requirement protein LtrA